jgi:hypothetical protein
MARWRVEQTLDLIPASFSLAPLGDVDYVISGSSTDDLFLRHIAALKNLLLKNR